MALIVIGGHSRSVGKTSVVAGLIAALAEMQWSAVKITQYGHGVCSANGKPCDCACVDHSWAISEECDRSGASDSSRFLRAGAARSLWVRTEQGRLAEAMPALQKEIAESHHVIMESNSILKFLEPDLYITILDPATMDFKNSAREFLDRAHAVILHTEKMAGTAPGDLKWQDVRLDLGKNRPVFAITPPPYVTREIIDFVRQRIQRPITEH
jgi:hypothetical protein